MDNFYLSALIQEATAELLGRTVVRVSLADSTLLIDLRLNAGRQLRASLDPTAPAFYLSTEIATQAKHGSTFFLSLLRKHLVDARLVKLWKEPIDRIVYLEFEKLDAGDNKVRTRLILMLTGRSANARLLEASGTEMGALFEKGPPEPRVQRDPPCESPAPRTLSKELPDSLTQSEALELFFANGSSFGPQMRSEFLARCHDASPSQALKTLAEDLFDRPPRPLLYSRLQLDQIQREVINTKTDLILSHIELAQARGLKRYEFLSLSEAADRYYAARAAALSLRARYSVLKHTLAREIDKRESAMRAIEFDRTRFEEPERLKRNGDLILANLANARVDGGSVTVLDYYASDPGEIEIDIPAGATLTEAASIYFSRYQKARRALGAIASRAHEVSQELHPLKQLLARLEKDPTSDNIDEVDDAARRVLGSTRGSRRGKEKRTKEKGGNSPGRRFRSSDGYEIMVGRNNRDNEALTFQVAKPKDIWLHAADYPGSHTIIRNPARVAPPHRTITEAAELAAFYSQAKREGKAAIHYTEKKFVSKPPRSKPGLVRLSSFKTIVVEPRCKLERLE